MIKIAIKKKNCIIDNRNKKLFLKKLEKSYYLTITKNWVPRSIRSIKG